MDSYHSSTEQPTSSSSNFGNYDGARLIDNSELLQLRQSLTEQKKLLNWTSERLSAEVDVNTQLRNELTKAKQDIDEKVSELDFMNQHLLKFEQIFLHSEEDLAKVESHLATEVETTQQLRVELAKALETIRKLEGLVQNSNEDVNELSDALNASCAECIEVTSRSDVLIDIFLEAIRKHTNLEAEKNTEIESLIVATKKPLGNTKEGQFCSTQDSNAQLTKNAITKMSQNSDASEGSFSYDAEAVTTLVEFYINSTGNILAEVCKFNHEIH